jgi:hypothetical protein
MSAAKLRFQVDSRLATLLSQEYRSTERALKELVDNAWDADADQVSIQLPKPLSGDARLGVVRVAAREKPGPAPLAAAPMISHARLGASPTDVSCGGVRH